MKHAALRALADPDAQPPRIRAPAWLAWALLLSVALHAAALSWVGTLEFRASGPLRLALTARLVPLPETPAAAAAPAAVDRVGEPAAEAPRARPAPPAPEPVQAAAALPPRYFTSREVDVPAALLEQPPLVYPEDPYLWKLAGKVRLRLFIGEDGRVESAEVVSARPPGHFEQAALDAGRAIRYQPALLGGRPVRSQKQIEVEFDPHERLRAAR